MPSVVSLIVSMTDISMINTPYMPADCVDEVLEKCENFADALKLIVSDLRQQGITQRSRPEFPKSDLLMIMGKEKTTENRINMAAGWRCYMKQ